MAFESGSMSFRMFYLPRTLPDDAVKKFAAHAAPPLDTIGVGEVRGWVTGRHLLDRAINENTAFYGGYLRLALRTAERRIPPALFRAECRMEELALMAAESKPFVKSSERAEIRKSVTDRLLPNMPPQLKAIPFIHQMGERWLAVSALSIGQSDQFASSFTSALGFSPVPLMPEAAAMQRRKVDVSDWRGTSFSPELDDDVMESRPGQEFLTWLWFMAETEEKVEIKDVGTVSLLVEGPLTFVREGNGAYIIVLKQGEPVNSAEAKTCLMSGKKLKQATLTLALNEQTWRTTLDADEFIFRSLQVPQSKESLDSISRFQERMTGLQQFNDVFFGLYDLFVEQRKSSAEWKRVSQALRKWAGSRDGRV
ncbi:MAG: recombination-associated protein RdgC [Lentisphaerota bacterium]